MTTTRASAPPTSTASGPPGLSPATAVLAADERDEVPDQHTAVRKAFAALEQAGLPAPDAVGHRVFTAAPTTRPTNGLMRALETICGGWPPIPRCMYRLPSRAWTEYPGTRKHGRASARP
jgi:hypothetical protein